MTDALLGVLHAVAVWLLGVALAFLGWLGGVLWVVGLWLTGLYDDAVRAWVDPAYAHILLDPRYHSMPLNLATVFVAFLLWRHWRASMRHRQTRTDDSEKLAIGPRGTPLLARLLDRLLTWLGLRRPKDLQVIAGERIDRRRRPHFAYSGETGAGKRLALDTPLPTPTGWTTMGEVQVGDTLFDERGQPCRVTYVSPVNLGDSYRVRFSDGSWIVADSEHLWSVWTRRARLNANRRQAAGSTRAPERWQAAGESCVWTTSAIREALGAGVGQVSIDNTAPLELPEGELPIAPYVLGCWLGDGRSQSAYLTTADSEVLDAIRAEGVGVGEPLVQDHSGRARTYYLGGRRGTRGGWRFDPARTNTLSHRLRGLGLIGSKHVPAIYLRASAAQRLALLQGLMDTDGGANHAGAEFTSTRKELADAVYELVVSLGMKATRREKVGRFRGVEHRLSYRVAFVPTMPVFRLPRKAARISFACSQQAKRRRRYVRAIEPVAPVPMRCIAVDSASHLYLAGPAMTPTHNTNLVARTRINGARPTVVQTFDFSGPLLGAVQALEKQQPGITVIWTPTGEVGLDLFLGTPREIARRWTAAFEDRGIGQYKRAMRRLMRRAIEEIDDEDADRSLQNFRDHLDPEWREEHDYPTKLSQLERNATDSWLLRLDDVLEDLAPTALGHDLDLAHELQRGRTVMFHVDAAVQDGTLAALAGLFTQENLRAMRKVRGGSRVIVEEAAAAVHDLDAFRLIMQAGRVRGFYVDVILQSLGDLPKFFRQNISGWVMFAQGEEQEKRAAAARTGLTPLDFDASKLPWYTAWLKVGRVLRRVKVGRAPEAVYEVDWDDEEDDDEEVPERPGPRPVRGGSRGPAGGKQVVGALGPGARRQGPASARGVGPAPMEAASGNPSGTVKGQTPSASAGKGRGNGAGELSPWDEFNSSPRWLEIWRLLGRPTRTDVCWLVPEKMVSGSGYASVSLGEKVGPPEFYRRFGQPNGKLEPKGPGRKYTLGHTCHDHDETCPGQGKGCIHQRCVNPFTAVPMSMSDQMAAQRLQQQAHQAWLQQQAEAEVQDQDQAEPTLPTRKARLQVVR